jgi:hypothetical protein
MGKLTLRLESLHDPDPWMYQSSVFDILNDYLQSDSAMEVQTAAAKINEALLNEKMENEEDEDDEDDEDDDETRDRYYSESDNEGRCEKEQKDIQKLDNLMAAIWEIIIELTKQIPYHDPAILKIVHLIKNLTLLPATTLTISKVCCFQGKSSEF